MKSFVTDSWPVKEYVTESTFKKMYLPQKLKVRDYSIHTLRGSCETGSDDSRVHITDYRQSAETKLGPGAVTFCPSVCPQCRQEASVRRRTHARGSKTTYRVVVAFCATFLRRRRHWDTFWPNLVRGIPIRCPRIRSLPTTANKDINSLYHETDHMKSKVILLTQTWEEINLYYRIMGY